MVDNCTNSAISADLVLAFVKVVYTTGTEIALKKQSYIFILLIFFMLALTIQTTIIDN